MALLLSGPALGLFAWQSDRVETVTFTSDVMRALGNVPSPWLALAFVMGVVIARPWWGALAGAAVLTLAVGTYYVAITLSGDRAGIPLRGALTGWLAVALVAGPIFGLAGAVWRNGPAALKPFAVGILTGALLGEFAYFTDGELRHALWDWQRTRDYLATAELLVAFSLPILLLTSVTQRLQAYITAAVMGAAALAIMLWLDQTMRDLFNA
jgi:hypothetical protein